MSTLNYIDENGNINKVGVIPNGYPARNIKLADGTNVQDAFGWEDITIQCTLYSGLSGTVVLYNKTLKMVRVQGILASGTPNGTTIITLPNTIKANGVQLLAQKYDTSDGKTITCVITDNSSNIVTEYSLSANAGVAQIITAFLMCK